MPTLLRWTLLTLAAGWTLAGCAPVITVSSHVADSLDATRYHTYQWGPADALPTGDPRLDGNPLFKDRVQGAVEKQLAARGIALTDAAPDLLIHYHANISTRLAVDRIDRGYGYTGDTNGLVEYEAGTLVIDIIDARTSRLIWRGWAQNSVHDLLDDPDRMARTIDEAVTRMMRQLPPDLGR